MVKKANSNLFLLVGLVITGLSIGTMPYWGVFGFIDIPYAEMINPPHEISSKLTFRYWIASIGLGLLFGSFLYLLLTNRPYVLARPIQSNALGRSVLLGSIVAAISGGLMVLSHQVGWNLFVPGTALLLLLFCGYMLILDKQGKIKN